MRDVPVVLDGYRITVVDPPALKTRTDEKTGEEVPVTDLNGVVAFVVSVFMKKLAQPGQRVPKGEEIKVTLATDPGEGFDADMRVELIGPEVSPFQLESNGRTISGISFRAAGMKPAGPAGGRKASSKAEPSHDENAA